MTLMRRSRGSENLLSRFLKESDGASLVEYSILIGLISATVLLVILAVSSFIEMRWTNLNSALT
jgi:pilus assembly protein Flp/PilA